MSKEPLEYLRHIRDECHFIMMTIRPGITQEKLIRDETLKRAVVRSLEIIGEATKKNPMDMRVKWTSVNWKDMAGMRDRLIHDYMGINYNIVWDVVKNKIPTLIDQIEDVIDHEEKK